MKKQVKPLKTIPSPSKSIYNFKAMRSMVSRSIPLEVDLDKSEIFFQNESADDLKFDISSNKIDNLISNYIDPKDSKKVKLSLTKAKQGIEKPILFNFIHPLTSRSFQFEYRYQIIYVKYASTRLKGVLVNVRDPKRKAVIPPAKKTK